MRGVVSSFELSKVLLGRVSLKEPSRRRTRDVGREVTVSFICSFFWSRAFVEGFSEDPLDHLEGFLDCFLEDSLVGLLEDLAEDFFEVFGIKRDSMRMFMLARERALDGRFFRQLSELDDVVVLLDRHCEGWAERYVEKSFRLSLKIVVNVEIRRSNDGCQ